MDEAEANVDEIPDNHQHNNQNELDVMDDANVHPLPPEAINAVSERAEPNIQQVMDEQYGARTSRYDLRPRRLRDNSHMFSSQGTLATSQMNIRQGLKMFGEEGVQAIKKELAQLHDREVISPRASKDLTPAQRKEALAYLMFLKRKICGKIKGRGCADGRKQRGYILRADATAPTVATEAVFLTAVSDVFEGRSVAIIDIPGAFIPADMDELVHMQLTGKIIDIPLDINAPMYKPCVVYEKGQKVLYVELLKALYGTIQAAQLGAWHVDDLKYLMWMKE